MSADARRLMRTRHDDRDAGRYRRDARSADSRASTPNGVATLARRPRWLSGSHQRPATDDHAPARYRVSLYIAAIVPRHESSIVTGPDAALPSLFAVPFPFIVPTQPFVLSLYFASKVIESPFCVPVMS